MAQATFSYRRSLELDPRGASALASLRDSFKARRMSDAQRAASERLLLLKPVRPGSVDATRAGKSERSQAPDGGAEPLPAWENGPDLARAVDSLIDNGLPEAAVRLFAEGVSHGIAPSWPVGDRVAATLLHLGRPAEAAELWERLAPPSRALQLARVATASLAMFDFETASRTYRSALEIDPNLPEAWFGGGCLMQTQPRRRRRGPACCTRGLEMRSPTPAQQAFSYGHRGLYRSLFERSASVTAIARPESGIAKAHAARAVVSRMRRPAQRRSSRRAIAASISDAGRSNTTSHSARPSLSSGRARRLTTCQVPSTTRH